MDKIRAHIRKAIDEAYYLGRFEVMRDGYDGPGDPWWELFDTNMAWCTGWARGHFFRALELADTKNR